MNSSPKASVPLQDVSIAQRFSNSTVVQDPSVFIWLIEALAFIWWSLSPRLSSKPTARLVTKASMLDSLLNAAMPFTRDVASSKAAIATWTSSS